jgi:diguanylate cyclase (GGDEF)-like protein
MIGMQTIQIAALVVMILSLAALAWLFVRKWKQLDLLGEELAALRRKFDEVVDRVDFDYLTGAFSRAAGERRMREALRCYPCVVVFIDLDDFKLINKAHGWAAGDEALKEIVAWLLTRFRRAHDTVYRMGGDEFVLVLPAPVLEPDIYAADQPPAADPLHLVEQFAQQNLREIAEECSVRFTFGLATTRQFPRHRVLLEAQEEALIAKRRRDALRDAAEKVDPAQAEVAS